MKKTRILAMILVLMLAVCALSACGSKGGNKYLGTWKLTGGSAMGVTIDDLSSFGLVDITIELKKDNVAKLTVTGEGSVDGSWKETSKGVEVTVENDPREFVADGDKLTLDQDGISLFFTKK